MQRIATDDFLANGKSGKSGNIFPKYYWITINPDPKHSLKDFQKLCSRIFSKKWIDASVYVLEMAEKFHCHAIIKTNNTAYVYSRARKEFLTSVKSVCNAYNQHIFVFEEVSEEVAKEKLSYMSGRKQDKKMDHVHQTVEWRKQENIPDFYVPRGALLTLLGPSETETEIGLGIDDE